MKTEKAIHAITKGGFLMAEYEEEDGRLHYRCVPGGGVSPNQAQTIIRQLGLIEARDSLFTDTPSQTWKMPAA